MHGARLVLPAPAWTCAVLCRQPLGSHTPGAACDEARVTGCRRGSPSEAQAGRRSASSARTPAPGGSGSPSSGTAAGRTRGGRTLASSCMHACSSPQGSPPTQARYALQCSAVQYTTIQYSTVLLCTVTYIRDTDKGAVLTWRAAQWRVKGWRQQQARALVVLLQNLDQPGVVQGAVVLQEDLPCS